MTMNNRNMSAELAAKRDAALAILHADCAQEKTRKLRLAARQAELEALGVDDPFFAKLAKAPVVVTRPEPMVVPEPVMIAAAVVVPEPVVEVVVTPPPVEPKPEHPVLALFKNWQERHGHAVTRNRPLAYAGASAK